MNKKFTIVLLLAFSALFLNAQNREFTTYTYFEHDTLALELDLFLPDNPENEKLPLLIYVHGGGFSQGNRASGHNLCSFLADSGFAAASITYTLYMKGKSFSCDGILSEKVKAIQFAASQLYQATAFLIDMADNFNIDTSSVFIAGSSAGAETVLQAAFWDYGTMNLYANNLPAGFSYAGVVSGAGA
ncbi:MAG: alpha/beta hydrolase, partial [Bacteroidota bacterium]